MEHNETGYSIVNADSETVETAELIKKIENAYRIYKLTKRLLEEVTDDYGRLKIAKLRFEFARHELVSLLKEAENTSIRWKDNETVRQLLYPDL